MDTFWIEPEIYLGFSESVNAYVQGVSIPTGEEARLAKMKPPIYGLSYLHTKCASWKAPNGGAISRNCSITHSRRTTHYFAYKKCLLEGGRYVKKGFTFANWPFVCIYWRRPGMYIPQA